MQIRDRERRGDMVRDRNRCDIFGWPYLVSCLQRYIALTIDSDGGYQPPKHMSAMVINAQCRWICCSPNARGEFTQDVCLTALDLRRYAERNSASLTN